MKILHIYKDYPPILGGIENHVQLLAQGQADRGHDVTVLVTNPAQSTRGFLDRLEDDHRHRERCCGDPRRPAGDGRLHAAERRPAVAAPEPTSRRGSLALPLPRGRGLPVAAAPRTGHRTLVSRRYRPASEHPAPLQTVAPPRAALGGCHRHRQPAHARRRVPGRAPGQAASDPVRHPAGTLPGRAERG